MPGGTDEVIRRAEKAAADNTASQPNTGMLKARRDDSGNLEVADVKYREYFPELDYARADLPNDIFFTPNIRIHHGNSYAAPGFYGHPNVSTDIEAAKYTALKHKQKFRHVLENILDPGNPVNEDIPHAAMMEALENSQNGTIPPHIVIGGLKQPSGDPQKPFVISPVIGDRAWHPSVMHEMGHHAHGTYADSLMDSRVVPPGERFDDFEEERALRMAGFSEQAPERQLPQSVLSDMDNADNAYEYHKQADLQYRTASIEADQMLADIKRAYFLNMGILADTPEKAGQALEWFRDKDWSDNLRSGRGQDVLETVATPYVSDFYSNPGFHGSQANKEIYKRRMTELYGIAAPLALQSLLSDEKQNDRQGNNVSY
jgi:hypothetical protein